MPDIHDFGEKIGGARKDMWHSQGLTLSDLTDMSATERDIYVKKENIWPKPNWEQQIADGKPQGLAYWQNKMRQAIPPKPPGASEEAQENYVEVVTTLRNAVMAIQEPYEIDVFYRNFLRDTYIEPASRSGYFVSIIPEAQGIVNNKVLKAAQSNYNRMKAEAEKKLFGVPKDEQIYVLTKSRLAVHCYDDKNASFEDLSHEGAHVLTVSSGFGRSFFYLREGNEFYDLSMWDKGSFFVIDNNKRQPVAINFPSRQAALEFIEEFARQAQAKADQPGAKKENEKTGKRRKTAFLPPQLKHVKRTGPNYRHLKHADGDLFMKDLNFRAGEFGNWLNENDRQTSLDMAYDALRDLARILRIRPEDVSLNGSLAIAFGARGKGGSGAGAAHYEPGRQVINLTKMSGAGCLAHEWGHALDHAIGLACNIPGLASEGKSRELPPEFSGLLSALKYKTVEMSAKDVAAEKAPEVEDAVKNLSAWLDSVKPKGLVESLTEAWDAAAKAIIDGASSFTGAEYMSVGRRDEVLTKPEIEMLSQISKVATNHTIPRDAKRQIAMWARELYRREGAVREAPPREHTVKTEFYKGSIEFDGIHSRAGHGYWQSDCEMFARSFDCYIADKIKADGNHSEYLSGHADSFVTTGKEGKQIAAIPLGEEREIINEKFDKLFVALKERGLLHDFVENLEETISTPEPASEHSEASFFDENFTENCEQMSFDDLLFSAQKRADDTHSGVDQQTKNISR